MVAGHNDGCADLIVFVGGGILFSYILNKWRQSVWSFDVECVCVCVSIGFFFLFGFVVVMWQSNVQREMVDF